MRAFASISRRAYLSAILVAASTAGAQLPSASAAAAGMAGNYGSLARGYEAIAWNPANLASPGRPFFSLGLLPISASLGLDPVDITTLHKLKNVVVDSATRAGWVSLVAASGRQRIGTDETVTPLALSIGPIGIATGVASTTHIDLGPGAFEAMMFGNAGNNNGVAKALQFAGTELRNSTFGTVAVSFALPLPLHFGPLPRQHFSVGVTGKYIGGGMVLARDAGTVAAANGKINVNFQGIFPDTALFSDNSTTKKDNPLLGIGTGADVGASWSFGAWKVGLMVENIYNSFKWDTTKFAYLPVTGTIDPSSDSSGTNSDQKPFSTAPKALRDIVLNERFKPAINLSAAFAVTSFLTVTGDYHKQSGGVEAISIGPTQRMGVGAELRILPFVPIRAGVASLNDGWQAGAGVGLRFFGYELGVSGSVRRRGAASESGVMVSAIGLGH